MHLGTPIEIHEELQRQWRWSVAQEIMPALDETRISKILEEIPRMEVFLDAVADRVKIMKYKLDEMEQEGGVILELKE